MHTRYRTNEGKRMRKQNLMRAHELQTNEGKTNEDKQQISSIEGGANFRNPPAPPPMPGGDPFSPRVRLNKHRLR